MIIFNRYWLALIMFATTLALPIKTMAYTPTIVISEIAWAGSSLSSSDEWIEFTNISEEEVDLSGWYLSGAGSGGAEILFPEGSIVAPNSTYLIANYAQTDQNAASGINPHYVTATLSLSNDGFALYLYDNHDSQIDSAGDGGSPFAGGSGGTQDNPDGQYRTMVRMDVSINGSNESVWADAVESIGYKDSINDYGSPGYLNVSATKEVMAEIEVDTNDEVSEKTETAIPTEETVGVSDQTESTPSDINESVSELDEEETVTQTNEEEALKEEQENAVTQTETEGESATTSFTKGSIIINEFVSNPSDGLEWIELKNISGESINLSHWQLVDEANQSTTIDSIELADEEYLVIQEPSGQLNNDEDSIRLIDPTGNVIDSVTYGTNDLPAPKTDQALAMDGGILTLTLLPTPGTPNLIVPEIPEMPEVDQEEKVKIEEVSIVEEESVETNDEPEATTLIFVEFYPNTLGADAEEEYLVLTNTGDKDINLAGWIIEDGATDRYIATNLIIAAGATETLLRTDTKLALNNAGDTLQLFAPDGTLIDQVTYGQASQGARYTLGESGWNWVGIKTEESTDSSSSKITNTTAETIHQVSISEAKNLHDDERVKIEGVVTVAPGIYANQYFYIQDETGGIQIYKYDGVFPELKEGDRISLTGTLSTSYGERRVKLNTDQELTISGGSIANVSTRNLTDVDSDLVGTLIETKGIIQSRSSNKVYLEHDGAELVVYLNSSPPLNSEQFSYGATATVTGILSRSNDELRIRPRTQNDINIEEEILATTALTGKDTFDQKQSQMGYLLFIATLGAIGILAVRRYYPQRKRQLAT